MNLHNKSNSSVMGGVASVLTLGLYSKGDQRDKVKIIIYIQINY